MQLLSDPFGYDDIKKVMRLTWFQVERILESHSKKANKDKIIDVPKQEIPTLEEFIAGLKREAPNRSKAEWYAMYSKFIKGLSK